MDCVREHYPPRARHDGAAFGIGPVPFGPRAPEFGHEASFAGADFFGGPNPVINPLISDSVFIAISRSEAHEIIRALRALSLNSRPLPSSSSNAERRVDGSAPSHDRAFLPTSNPPFATDPTSNHDMSYMEGFSVLPLNNSFDDFHTPNDSSMETLHVDVDPATTAVASFNALMIPSQLHDFPPVPSGGTGPPISHHRCSYDDQNSTSPPQPERNDHSDQVSSVPSMRRPKQQVLASSDAPVYPLQGTRCHWDGDCDVTLDDVTPSGIERHIREVHLRGNWNRQVRGACTWVVGDRPCERKMMQGGYGKHVASIHLQSTAVVCDVCGKTYCRSDVLQKHKLLHARDEAGHL
ncbi:hypothetical protein SCP_1500520 [Sparassis crispa]|uniref:C2H2-type domain-containing protein n=1 Tax=Sparassis crispa TaxID=139825 RepID=A0A401H3X9_9APHY|nr:hypothetical protein SCP_1500520 [Sparassis crispa]GBE89050.1 hypothetical protein SCP_1500520 [Sparassis crispa]